MQAIVLISIPVASAVGDNLVIGCTQVPIPLMIVRAFEDLEIHGIFENPSGTSH
jgi:hypothetical protein